MNWIDIVDLGGCWVNRAVPQERYTDCRHHNVKVLMNPAHRTKICGSVWYCSEYPYAGVELWKISPSLKKSVDLLRVSGFRFFRLVLNRSSVFKSSLRLFSAKVVPWFFCTVWEKKRCRTNKIEYSTLNKAELFHILDMLYFEFSLWVMDLTGLKGKLWRSSASWTFWKLYKMDFFSDNYQVLSNMCVHVVNT